MKRRVAACVVLWTCLAILAAAGRASEGPARLDGAQRSIRVQPRHPLEDPLCPFGVKILVRDPARGLFVERKPVFRDGRMLVSLQEGEVYQVRVEVRPWQGGQETPATSDAAREALAGPAILMRLLVDGLNTLPEKTPDSSAKAVAVAPAPAGEYRMAAPVPLEQARFWVLRRDRGGVYVIPGFFRQTSPLGNYREFTVVAPEESLAAQQKKTDQIGVISVALYAPKPPHAGDGIRGIDPSQPGTGAGQEATMRIDRYEAVEVGELLSLIQIHYIDPAEIAPLEAPETPPEGRPRNTFRRIDHRVRPQEVVRGDGPGGPSYVECGRSSSAGPK